MEPPPGDQLEGEAALSREAVQGQIMATFRLSAEGTEGAPLQPAGWERLGTSVLLLNALWFSRIRWAVVSVLGAFAAASAIAPRAVAGLGLVPVVGWPMVLAAMLAIENVLCFKDRERNLCFRIADFNIYQQNLLCPIEMHKGGDPKDKSGTHFAPEEVNKENFGLAADVWRFGVLVFLLTNNDHDKTDAYEAVCDDKKRYDKMVGKGAHLVADPRERVAGPSMAAFWTAEEKKWK